MLIQCRSHLKFRPFLPRLRSRFEQQFPLKPLARRRIWRGDSAILPRLQAPAVPKVQGELTQSRALWYQLARRSGEASTRRLLSTKEDKSPFLRGEVSLCWSAKVSEASFTDLGTDVGYCTTLIREKHDFLKAEMHVTYEASYAVALR